ncbi:hypothetical protein [Ramlibacter algicola]|uniref:Uncharacterized protein n=1 Tax=Ramlibacter algicola TaxID=2795217 RepID=A0A934Q1M4_9BURK|nr:hypothetical protein [Ramlibacter algicola]MBK0392622.1 hypothetical protein [Ramlibacter algicola]
MINLLEIQPGQTIRLKNGTTAEVVENIGDGIWLNARFESGDEELVFCEDIAALEESKAQ